MSKYLIAGIILCLCSGIGSATSTNYCWADGDEEGSYHDCNSAADGAYFQYGQTVVYCGCGEHLWIKYYVSVNTVGGSSVTINTNYHHCSGCSRTSATNIFSDVVTVPTYREGIHEVTGASGNQGLQSFVYGSTNTANPNYACVSMIVSNVSLTEYTISGSTDCLTCVDLIYQGNVLNSTTLSGSDSYNYLVLDNHTYKLSFNNGAEYEFTVNGSNINYDYDACINTYYRFVDRCDNLIPDSEGYYTPYTGFFMSAWDFYAPSGTLSIESENVTKLALHTQSFIGDTGWVIDPVVEFTEYTLINPVIAWGLKVKVINASDETLIDGAMVKVEQGCYCNDEYSTRQKMTVNGMVSFNDMSLQDASLHVTKAGYKFCDENNTGYDVFLSGRANFSSKTWLVKLEPNTGGNESEWYEVGNKVNIHFRNKDGVRTSQVNDSQSEIYLYYENNNTDNEAMTLKFQSSSTHTYFIDELSWSIPHDSIGYKTIANSYFTPYDYSYRAVIYNSSIYGWNITIPLTVRNTTTEEQAHYENLSTNLWFFGEEDGKIDYREDMRIVSHACSNNTTLMDIDLEVWKDGSLLCYKNMSASDYINADFPYYYLYEPSYDYESGSNYTIKMYGFDRTLLEVRYVECITDSTTRKNKLTIVVKDKYGSTLTNAFIFLKDYGSLSTGTNYYNSYEGLDNGYYRYKATKTGYIDGGWDDVTLTDGDQTKTYTLTATVGTNATTNIPTKTSDDELSSLYIMMMGFLLICLLFATFINLCKGGHL